MQHDFAAGVASASSAVETTTLRKLRTRLLPFMFLLYVVAVLDRVNVGFAALTMNKELAISGEQFGLLAGIFFVGYFLFEIPSNLLLHRFGARVWMARILVTWGLIAGATALVRTAHHLYIARFCLGLAEAGFFPGMILYLTYWFRQREQAEAVALFMAAQPVTAILGSPISGLILDHVRWFHISSWRWLLALEAIPAVLLGLVTYLVLPNGPADARFLTEPERTWLTAELERERREKPSSGPSSAASALWSGRVWHLAAIYFSVMIGLYSMNFWLPQVIKGISRQYSNTSIGLLVMVPHLCGLLAMLACSRHSDRTGERRLHAAIPLLLASGALFVVGRIANPVLSVALLSVMAIGILSSFGPFWSLPSRFLVGAGAASGIALVNSVGNLGGFVGPYVIGAVSDRTGSKAGGLAFVGVAMTISALLILRLVKNDTRTTGAGEA